MSNIIEQMKKPGGGMKRPGGTQPSNSSQNITTPTTTAPTTPTTTAPTTPTTTAPKKRGTQLNTKDYEGINFKYNYPGDRNYVYGVKNKDWYAKNKNNGKVFNISKDGFTSSVDKLNSKFPGAFKEVVQTVSPETKTPVTTQDSMKVGTYVPPVKPIDSVSGEPDDLSNY